MVTHVTYGPGGFKPGRPDKNIVETSEVIDPAPAEVTVEDRLAALEAKTADIPAKGR